LNDRIDDNVIRACQNGDRAAYAALVKTCYKSVFALCLGILGNTHDAEDAAQEAMLKGIEKGVVSGIRLVACLHDGDTVVEHHAVITQHQPVAATANGQLQPRIRIDAVQEFGRIRPLSELLAGIQEVTAADVQRVAAQYLVDGKRSVVHVIRNGGGGGSSRWSC